MYYHIFICLERIFFNKNTKYIINIDLFICNIIKINNLQFYSDISVVSGDKV